MTLAEEMDLIEERCSEEERDPTEEELAVFLTGLSSPDYNEQVLATYGLIAFSRETLLKVIDALPSMTLQVRILWVPYLASMEFYEPYWFLLNEMRTTSNEVYANLIVNMVAKTEYFVAPLLLQQLSVENDRTYVMRIRLILERMGFLKLKPFLGLFPELPHEAVLREIFGNDLIDSLSLYKD